MRNELQEARKMCADWEKGPVDLSIVEKRILIPLKYYRDLTGCYTSATDHKRRKQTTKTHNAESGSGRLSALF
jgi:hypothetical protein